jgi:hypothetical protein
MMTDIGAQLLAELRGVPVEDYLTERSHMRRSIAAKARRYKYPAQADVRWELDWEDRPVLVRRNLATSNEWEAMQVALFTETMDTLAAETGLSVSRVVRGLEGFARAPAGHVVRRYTVRPFAFRRYW